MTGRRTSLLASLVLLACGGDADPLAGVPPERNPLGDPSEITVGGMALPMPSSVWLRDDAGSTTGVRVDFPQGSLPANGDGISADPSWLNEQDGFSTAAPILVHFPQGVRKDDLPSHTDYDASLDPACPTVLIDMDTGDRVAHFAEVDEVAADFPDDQALIIRPARRLAPGHRYAVGLRRSLLARDGQPLAVPPGFQAILDGTTTGHERLERVRPRYPEIFAALDAAGVPKDDLVLAWDFVTATDDLVRADLVAAREVTLAAMQEGTWTFNVTYAELPADWDPAISLRKVEGTLDVPQVLEGDAGNDALLARDASGAPMVVGVYQAPFRAVIPACAVAQKPVPVIIYGHGLMGSPDEAIGGYPRRAAEYMCAVIIGTAWRGMSEDDLVPIALALNEASRIPQVMEKLVQGIVNFLALEQLVRTGMANIPAFQDGGEPLVDPTRVHYYGISQGGIFGGTFMAYSSVERGVLQVGASNYSMMLERSCDFPTYRTIMNGAYTSYLDQQILLSLLQTGWDKTEPVTTADGLLGVNASPVPGVAQKQILMQIARDDSQVPNVASEYEARQMGIPVLTPSIHLPWGVQGADGPLPSAMTIWDQDLEPKSPLTNLPPDEDNGTHGSLRKQAAANEQIRVFLETGEVVQTCLDTSDQPRTCDCTIAEVCGPEI